MTMDMSNVEILEKTFSTGQFLYGGQLSPRQQDRFIVLLKESSKLLPLVRFKEMKQLSEDIDKLHISEPVTESIDENNTSTNTGVGVFGRIRLNAKKLRSAWNITKEALDDNIEQENFADTLMRAMSRRIASDLEMLAIQGDSTLAGTDPRSRLLKRLDGWEKQTDLAHTIDAGRSPISSDLLSAALRAIPDEYKEDPNLAFIMPMPIWQDWLSLLAERGTPAGDSALGGQGVSPFGVRIIQVPLMPSDLPITSTVGLPAQLYGSRVGPFAFTAANDTLIISISGGANRTITFAHDVLDTVAVVNAINSVFIANGDAAFAYDDGHGRLVIETKNIGVAQSITLQAGSTAADTLGFPTTLPTTVNGVDAGTSGTLREGSSIWLTNPKNLIFGLVRQTRIYSEFNKDYDRIETVVYNQVDVKVENLDAFVKIKNVVKRPL